MRITGAMILGVLAAGWLSGCHGSKPPAVEPLIILEQENAHLQRQIIDQNKQIEQLQKQMAQLRGMSEENLAELIQVERIEFGRFTRAFDEDEDGFDDGIVVYLQTVDREGDRIKSAGTVQLELWDLRETEEKRQLGEWYFDIEALGDYWLSGPLTNHFKFELDWPKGIAPSHENLTVKLIFSDALTGKVFEIQQMVTARIR